MKKLKIFVIFLLVFVVFIGFNNPKDSKFVPQNLEDCNIVFVPEDSDANFGTVQYISPDGNIVYSVNHVRGDKD